MATVPPKLSVAVLNYNYGRYLSLCLDSILEQTWRDFEVIVIDDCSTDDSLKVLEEYKDDPRMRIVAHEANRGYLDSLVEGTELHSQGEFLTVISADDLVRSPRAFERQVALLDAHPNVGFCFAAYDKLTDDEAASVGTHMSHGEDGVIAGEVALHRIIGDPMMRVLHTGTVIRRSAYRRAGGYRRDVQYAVDLAMWLSLSIVSDVGYIAEPLYGYRTHDSQMSGSLEGYRALMRETFSLADEACGTARLTGREARRLKRSAADSYLFGWAMDEAFHGARLMPLRRCLAAVSMRPAEALTSKKLWVILMRVALGHRGFHALKSVVRSIHRPLRRRARIAKQDRSPAVSDQ